MLRRNDANPNKVDNWSRTPLSLASMNGHKGVVKILFERSDVSPNITDTHYGRTPLWWAVEKEREAVVKILLKRNDANPNTPEADYGRTPLLWAARGGMRGSWGYCLNGATSIPTKRITGAEHRSH